MCSIFTLINQNIPGKSKSPYTKEACTLSLLYLPYMSTPFYALSTVLYALSLLPPTYRYLFLLTIFWSYLLGSSVVLEIQCVDFFRLLPLQSQMDRVTRRERLESP